PDHIEDYGKPSDIARVCKYLTETARAVHVGHIRCFVKAKELEPAFLKDRRIRRDDLHFHVGEFHDLEEALALLDTEIPLYVPNYRLTDKQKNPGRIGLAEKRLTLHPNRHQFFRLVRTSTRAEDVARVVLRLHQACDQQRLINVDLVGLPLRLNKRPNRVRNKTLPTRLHVLLQRAAKLPTCPKV